MKYWPGMYYFDTNRYNQVPVNAYYFLSTIKYNKSYFSQNEIEGADRALDLQGKIGWPYVQDYQNIITKNKIINTKFTANRIKRA